MCDATMLIEKIWLGSKNFFLTLLYQLAAHVVIHYFISPWLKIQHYSGAQKPNTYRTVTVILVALATSTHYPLMVIVKHCLHIISGRDISAIQVGS